MCNTAIAIAALSAVSTITGTVVNQQQQKSQEKALRKQQEAYNNLAQNQISVRESTADTTDQITEGTTKGKKTLSSLKIPLDETVTSSSGLSESNIGLNIPL